MNNEKYNKESNLSKEISSIAGVAEGIIIDKKINDNEIKFFMSWIKIQKHASDIPHYKEIITAIEKIKEKQNKNNTDALIEIIEKSVEKIKSLELIGTDEKSTINHAIGVVRGILADNEINNTEIESLVSIMKKTESKAMEQYHNILSKISDINSITDTDRETLKKDISKIIGGSISDHGVIDGMTISIDFDKLPDQVMLDGLKICLTGTFFTMPRKQVKYGLEMAGAMVGDSVTGQTDMLIVGGMSSSDWAFSTFGRKIEKAIILRKSKGKPFIIDEGQIVDHIKYRS